MNFNLRPRRLITPVTLPPATAQAVPVSVPAPTDGAGRQESPPAGHWASRPGRGRCSLQIYNPAGFSGEVLRLHYAREQDLDDRYKNMVGAGAKRTLLHFAHDRTVEVQGRQRDWYRRLVA